MSLKKCNCKEKEGVIEHTIQCQPEGVIEHTIQCQPEEGVIEHTIQCQPEESGNDDYVINRIVNANM